MIMKTIEEENNEYVRRKYGFASAEQVKETLNVFKAGVKFAQRWIPVEEELPKINESVLIKIKINGKERVIAGHLFNGDFYMDYSDSYSPVKDITHWRQIEIK